ncbi:hypothetical protein BH23ACT6_BH23ACT6_28260 [soil metagenome]
MMLAGLPVVVAAEQSTEPRSLAATTVVHGEASAVVPVRVSAPWQVDLRSAAGGLMPTSLQVQGGHGHVGVMLRDRAPGSRAAVLLVRFPTVEGSPADGIGWGRDANGVPCEVCLLAPGDYDLEFINDSRTEEGSGLVLDVPATVTVSASSEPDRSAVIRMPEGTRTTIRQGYHELDGQGAPPLISGVSGFVAHGPQAPQPVGENLLVRRQQVAFTQRATPPALSEASFCWYFNAESRCEDHSLLVGEASWNAVSIDTYSATEDHRISTQLEFASAGDIRHRVRSSALFVPLGAISTESTDAATGETPQTVSRVRFTR